MEDLKLMKNDSFLKYIWNKYDLENEVNKSDKNKFLLSCAHYIPYDIVRFSNEKIDICITFLRNLKELYNSNTSSDFFKHCYNIYYWLYYEIKDDINSDKYINSIFEASTEIAKERNKGDNCSDSDLYKDWEETEKLVMLHIFNNNIDDIQEILNKECDSNRISCKKFVKKCVDLYTSMQHYLIQSCKNSNSIIEKTCLAVKTFKEKYEELYSNQKIENEFPALSSYTPIIITDDCPKEKSKSDEASLVQNNQSDQASTVHSNKSDGSIIQSVPRALGLMAGIPPLLVLIYKVNIILIQKF
ncbi:hypothetical protein PCYB_003480 [Plasmodium cynomolgi strain B]|uniref:CYIR protein n=1 Tax=Plasmodium cynomolgi (strain B) TaxID=1120755 RepID=K6V012_PLACD|nr:hypothetical protein PCYB_003480 [Plasmodium cynomolgi strain B]GAB69599.1 hypothetical protein PCYB_003480 [Plasmodium cynomolgi strain B]